MENTDKKENYNIQEIFDLVPTLDDEDKKLIQKAYDFAKKAHADQKRESGEPYFVHVFETAKNIASFGMNAITIAAGLLHDTLEDAQIPEETLKKEFGEEIYFLINGVTKLGKLKYRGEVRHVESLRKFLVAMAENVGVLIIKLADRLHNVSTLQYVREDKRKRIALETIEIYASLANRLGMGKLKGSLEDYSFPFAYPKEYQMVEELIKEKKNINQKYLEKVSETLNKELKSQGLKNFKTDYRIKHKYSLYKKLLKNKMDIEKVYDIVALRVVVQNVEDCYRVLGIVHSLWKPLPGRIKDYIALPKLNGYQSIHTTIFTGDGGIAEIQIRTKEMHQECEYGIASHFLYKENSGKKMEKKIEWIGQMKDLQKNIADPVKFLEHLRMDFFRDRIFIFTPEGDVIDLPEGSFPLDFAYAVHSEIGDKASGVKINGKYKSLETKLENGDIIEIVINKNSHPTRKWLDCTRTSLAKRHVRNYLKATESPTLKQRIKKILS